ncbi:MAG TPA: hypothetical protein VEZ40_18420, partial [Pyrinomonadaceae bacterium]|nr:hypothetical protein [Pyrinomonadaceae bacterium]
ETCAACAARLAQEQQLTSALRLAAGEMKDLSAPARVEANLLAAFQAAHAHSQASTTNASPGIAAAPHAPRPGDETAARVSMHRRTWRAAFVPTAVAASLALVAFVTLYKQFTRTAPPPEMPPGILSRSGAEPSPVAPAVDAPSPSPASVASATEQTKRDRPQPSPRAGTQRAPAGYARAATPGIIASRQVIDGGDAIFAPGEGESAANHASGATKPNEAESVTEFLPLVAGAPASTPLESGQLIRVQLPRAALSSLGLPLNAERGNEPVKADVLLGNDGRAHAIRFVR